MNQEKTNSRNYKIISTRNRLCYQNPFASNLINSLDEISERMNAYLEPSFFEEIVHQARTNNTWTVKWNVFNPIQVMSKCQDSQRVCIGGECREDKSKITCGVPALKPGCVVYSIGGDNNWDFELDLLEKTDCLVHTFDCTGPKERYLPPESSRLFFHHICLGTEYEQGLKNCTGTYNVKCGETWTLQDIQKRLGHGHVDLLKMDIEGFEWGIIESLPELPSEDSFGFNLPMQVNVELHTVTLDDKGKYLYWTAEQVSRLYKHLLQAGYVVIERDDNIRCPHCTELTLMLVRCPAWAV